MEWLCVVMIEFNGVCIHESSPTLQITPRSRHFVSHSICVAAHCFIRVLLATIQDQGLFLCPHCLAPKSKLDQLGHIADMKDRIDKACKYCIDLVNEVQKAIFEEGKPISGVAVENLLKDMSAVPILVCPQLSDPGP